MSTMTIPGEDVRTDYLFAEAPHIPAPRAARPTTDETFVTVVDAAAPDIVEIWGLDSFPASDPPANW